MSYESQHAASLARLRETSRTLEELQLLLEAEEAVATSRVRDVLAQHQLRLQTLQTVIKVRKTSASERPHSVAFSADDARWSLERAAHETAVECLGWQRARLRSATEVLQGIAAVCDAIIDVRTAPTDE
ncbi:hypothetical protein [Cryptosporangium sp. NPDC048952]|uniref:hypothetical protein n=1 Tax=Cryptosporangium sp. NPDC048952 TaxID=3363961 RepID=UPI00371ED012